MSSHLSEADAAPAAYCGRFAPSPTGRLHLGHARTYLVAWLRARSLGGRILMRMEDLDPPRIVPGAAEAIYDDVRWLGLDWDSEPERQSEHGARYEAALQALTDGGFAYPCTCTRKEIAAVSSAPHGVEGLGARYSGTCLAGPTHPDRLPAWRFRMPEPAPSFADAIHGQVSTAEWGGDFVVRRADGLWAYQLAVVVDDAMSGVTEVVRGDDLLPSTPRQIALYHALGYDPPRFVHLPLVLGPDGERLSKRHSSAAVADHRAAGTSPERVMGILAASLGLAKGHSIRPQDLIGQLRLEDLPTEPMRLDHPTL